MKPANYAKTYLVLFVFLVPLISEAQGLPEKGIWYFQPSAFFFDLAGSSSKTSIGGVELPGENVSFTNSTVPGVGVGYFVSANVSIYTVVAYPPTTTAEGINALAGLTAAEVTYAPFALSGLYHFDLGNFQPFIGGGISYAAILNVEDRDVTEVEAENAFGFIIRGGAEYMLGSAWGISVSVNKLFIDTEITGNSAQGPAFVEVSLDPWVYSLGLVYRR